MEGKRYYWLRLKDDFFGSIRIKKLRKMAGGDTYCIIYLKMQLKAIKTDGVLTYKGYEETFVDELALDLDEEPDNVRVTLAYLCSCGLIETQDNTNFFLPYAIENTGSETSAAERMRKMRERKELPAPTPPKTNAERQRAFRAKQNTEQQQHIPLVEDYSNQKRYGGNYYLVCQRERFKCAICESTENLCVHHIDGYAEDKPENNALNKMVLLCRKCHSIVHAGTPIPQDVLDRIEYDRNVTSYADVTPLLQDRYVNIDTKEKEKNKDKSNRFTPPTVEEVRAYCKERRNNVNAEHFVDYYEANGWRVGKNPMRDWKAAIRTWERNETKVKPKIKSSYDDVKVESGDDTDRLAERFGING